MTADARVVRAGVLGVWAGFFGVLWVTGRWTHYLGPRTSWIVPFGAVSLTLLAVACAIVHVRSQNQRHPLTLRETVGLLALLVPLGLVVAMPNARLGAFAASRKADSGYFRTLAPRPPKDHLTLLDLRVAEGQQHVGAAERLAGDERNDAIGGDRGAGGRRRHGKRHASSMTSPGRGECTNAGIIY